ncbi:FHA domain-containing protein [Kovacikia minuta CCNUW1]|uniref:FHA domain-containing protein n=1 Tax=Kovacikia minuta TaxID=2931930 RepID=UPI001CCA9A58|nr:FHA domain-containing protein [Kovacikia minuta]UBF27879.1 FHA domain-containing protein [Kovacikia minuta CCNUW1]
MIVCPNCTHQNPDGAVQCEACYTPLPATMGCPNCGSTVQVDASFCGQCGFNLSAIGTQAASSAVQPPPPVPVSSPSGVPSLIPPDPLVPPDPIVGVPPVPNSIAASAAPSPDVPVPPPPVPVTKQPVAPSEGGAAPAQPRAAGPSTQLQQAKVQLLHVQTNTPVELPQSLSVIHIGKPNDRIPPDVDVSGFPDSEIVSRIHADIRVEGDSFYIEDVGSSNGTYINNAPLPMGNRHRLRHGDRVALGKGDKVTFLFQLS